MSVSRRIYLLMTSIKCSFVFQLKVNLCNVFFCSNSHTWNAMLEEKNRCKFSDLREAVTLNVKNKGNNNLYFSCKHDQGSK